MNPIITLTSDFGMADGFVGIMKGVIKSIIPDADIVDLSHEIGAQNILEAQFLLTRAAPYFPAGTIHVVVVDPGVGTNRRAIVVQTDEAIFVGPDNGLFTPWFPEAEVYRLTEEKYFLENRSATFHGRDVFAPVAAHLANSISPTEMGTPIEDPVVLELPRFKTGDKGIEGEIIHVDRFGNLITNIPERALGEFLKNGRELVFEIGDRKIIGLSETYGDKSTGGELMALIGSHGNLEIALPMGDACKALGIKKGSPVTAGEK